MLNPEHKLILNYFKSLNKNQSQKLKQVLDLSGQSIPFTNAKVKHYFEPQCTRLPYENQRFDFVFSRERDHTRMFISPLTAMNELMRVSRTGMIQSVSPLEALLFGRNVKYITWSEPLYNRLCVLPYWGGVHLNNKHKWLDLVNFNSIYLNHYYYWSNTLEMNVQTFFGDSMEYNEYAQLLNRAVEESTEHTRLLLKTLEKPQN